MLYRIYQKWKQLHWLPYVLVALLLSLLAAVPIAAIYELTGIEEIGEPNLLQQDAVEQILGGVIMIPLPETWLNQHLPIWCIQKLTGKRSYYLCLVLPAIIFAAMHVGYSLWYGILVLPMGLLLGEAYLVFQQRGESPFRVTFTLHALRILLAFVAGMVEP